MTDLQAQLRELISKKLAELSSIDFSKNAPYSDREEALKAIVILTDCVCKLETTRGKVIYNYRGNSGRSLDVATPVTAHHRAEHPATCHCAACLVYALECGVSELEKAGAFGPAPLPPFRSVDDEPFLCARRIINGSGKEARDALVLLVSLCHQHEQRIKPLEWFAQYVAKTYPEGSYIQLQAVGSLRDAGLLPLPDGR